MTNITHIAPYTIEEFGLLEESPPYLQIGLVQGASADAFTLDTGTFFTFLNGAGEIEQTTYSSFLQTFVDYLAFIGFGTWTYSYDFATCTLTIDGGANIAAFTFDDTSKKILGMESSVIEKSLYTNTTQPWFIWQSTEGDWQNVSYPYESVTVVREKECDDGRVYQLSNEDDLAWLSNKPLNITYLDWEHHWEPKTNIYNDYSSSANSYTYQQHLSHIRSGKPFAVFQGCTGSSTLYSDRKGTYKIRADKSNFNPVVSNKNLDSFWNITVETRQLSLGTNFGTYNPVTAYELFEPRSIDNCILWLDAGVGAEVDAFNNFTWQDQSSNGYVFYGSDILSPPTITVSSSYSGMNNKPTVIFGTDDLVTSSLAIDFVTASSATVFAAFNHNQPGSLLNTQIFNNGLFLSDDGISMEVTNATSIMQNSYYSGSMSVTQWTGSNPIPADTTHIISTVFQTYNSSLYFDGSIKLDGVNFDGGYSINPLTDAGTIKSEIALIGFKLRLSELIIFNRELLDSEITQVNNYLAEKYGI